MEARHNPGVLTSEIEGRENSPRAERPAARVRRVFFLLDSLNLGGTETQAVELARRLDATRYQVTLGCLRARGPLRERLNGSFVTLKEFYPQGGVDSIRGIYQVARLAAFLRSGGFHIFHSHDLWSNLMGVPAAWMARVPVIISSQRDLAHLDWYRSRKRPWLRRMQRLSDAVVANADAIRTALVADGLASAKIHVIANGVDLEKFAISRGSRERLFPGKRDAQLIVLVGNMHSDVKGHPWLIRAAPAILQEFPNALFVLVGDGQQRQEFEGQVRDLGLSQNFMFLGTRTDVGEILACSDIAVLPSKAEGTPNALLEYMAAGLPLVATRAGGNAEVIEHEKSGLLVPPQDDKNLSTAILRLLRDPELARRLAFRGQDRVRRNFSYDELLRNIDHLYSSLLAQQEARA